VFYALANQLEIHEWFLMNMNVLNCQINPPVAQVVKLVSLDIIKRKVIN
jgi:hypothetical protein